MKIWNLEMEAQLSSGRKYLFAAVALFVLVFSLYLNTFYASWKFDDEPNIIKNQALHLEELNWESIKGTFFAHHSVKGKLYRPIACFSFALNYYLGELNVFGYHLVNVSIHFFTSIFLFLFIYHTLNLPLLKARYGPYSYFIALLATVFWAINPVQTQAVAYIVQRMASMSAMFYIMAMYFYLKGRTSQKGTQRIFHYPACLICGLLAFGTKENTVMLPFSLFFFDLFLVQGTKDLTKERARKNILVFLLLICVPLIFAVILRGPSVLDFQGIISRYEANRPFTMGERLLTQPRVILLYISLLLYPMPNRLCISHDIPLSHGLIDPPATLAAIIAVLAVLGVSVLKSGKWPFICFCIFFYFLNHLIEGTILPLEICFEHRNYLPSLLFFAPLAILFLKGVQLYSHKRSMQVILSVFVVLVLIAFGHGTFIRNLIWVSKESVWLDAVEKVPNLGRPYNNLGRAYTLMGEHEKAITQFKAALSKECVHQTICHAMPYYNLGWEYQRKGMLDEALAAYREATKLVPMHTNTHNNMGILFVKKNMLEEAERAFRNALSYDNNHFLANKNFGTLLLFHMARVQEAIPLLEKAMKENPDDPQLLRRLAYGYRVVGEQGKARRLFERTLGFKVFDPKVLLYLSEIYLMDGREDKAEKLINRFAVSGNITDIGRYMDGSPEKDLKLDFIWPYKRMVLERLSEVYFQVSSNYREREEYVRARLTETQGSSIAGRRGFNQLKDQRKSKTQIPDAK